MPIQTGQNNKDDCACKIMDFFNICSLLCNLTDFLPYFKISEKYVKITVKNIFLQYT